VVAIEKKEHARCRDREKGGGGGESAAAAFFSLFSAAIRKKERKGIGGVDCSLTGKRKEGGPRLLLRLAKIGKRRKPFPSSRAEERTGQLLLKEGRSETLGSPACKPKEKEP